MRQSMRIYHPENTFHYPEKLEIKLFPSRGCRTSKYFCWAAALFMPKWGRKSALPICNYSQILYQFLTFTQNLKMLRLIINILILFFTLPTNLAVQFMILSRGYTGVSLKNRNKITLR